MFMPFSCTMLRDRLIPSIWCCDSHRYISYLTLTCIHQYLPCYTYYLISGTCHAMLITWYLILVLAMLYLTYDTRHRYFPCYIWHMIPDTGTFHAIFDLWYLTPVLAMLYLIYYLWHPHTVFTPTLDMLYLILDPRHLISDTGTCHAILITWYLTPVLAMLHLTLDILPPGTNTLGLILWYLTGYYYTGHRTSLHIHDSHFYGDLIIILLPDIWYSWTPVLLNSCIPEPLKRGDSWYYTPIDPRNRITINIGLL